jgi:hypothetical protein
VHNNEILENPGLKDCSAVPVGLLPRRPAPKCTESLFSYPIRLSEKNGFESPWSLFKRAHIDQHEWRTRGAHARKLASIVGCKGHYLEEISYCLDRMSRSYTLLGHPISATDIEPDRPKLCVECVQDKGFVEAHWDLVVMIACPIHATWACQRCLSCGQNLGLYRPGLLKCSCGSSLQVSESAALRSRGF